MAEHRWDVSTEDGFLRCYHGTFAEVYRYAAMLCGSDRPAAEDLVQEVYLAALDRARRGLLAEASVGWFVTAARHRFVDRLRSSQRERRRLELVASVPAEPQLLEVPGRLATLPDRERAALVLRFVDDLTVAQVGDELGIGVRAAESLVARAVRRLRDQEARHA
jgi:RNA polymerase sigma-70 factor (ECF subfamily)